MHSLRISASERVLCLVLPEEICDNLEAGDEEEEEEEDLGGGGGK